MRVHVDPAVAELQKLRPAKLRVFVRDENDPKAVAIPGTRKKWESLAKLLEGLDWLRIEALDPRGNITGVVARDEPESSDIGEDIATDEAERLEPLLALMLKAQTVALDRQASAQKPLIDGMGKLVAVVTDALGAVAGAYRMALAAASSVPTIKGSGEPDDDGVSKFLQFAMMMAMKGGSGPVAAVEGVKAAKVVADVKARDKAPPAPQGANGVAPGR